MMDITTIIMALGGAQLLFMALTVDTANFMSAIVFRVFSCAIGLPLSFMAFGRFMGWPI